jgi:magnesium transporter
MRPANRPAPRRSIRREERRVLTVYRATPGGALQCRPYEPGEHLDGDVIWLDLLNPEQDEDKAVEVCVGVEIPTQEDMSEIEASSRLYVDNGARYMTVPLLAGSRTGQPGLVNISFILAGKRLVTVRHAEPRVIALFIQRVCKLASGPDTGESVLMGLLDAIIDRTADILEHVGADVEEVSKKVFADHKGQVRAKRDYMAILRRVGGHSELLSMARESLVAISRMVGFLSTDLEGKPVSTQARGQLAVVRRDAESLRDHASYLGDKIIFLLDATVGMVTIEQNDLVKLFSVVSVILMPPTLIASTYGMNFQFMPELNTRWGYPLALLAMLLSAVVPYLIFRMKRWL